MTETLTLPDMNAALARGPDGSVKIDHHWYTQLQKLVRAVNTPAAAAATPDMLELIAEGTLSGTEVVITDISQEFSKLMLRITGMSFDTAVRNPLLQVSNDNGSSFDTTAGNYSFFTSVGAVSTASLLLPLTHTLAADVSDHILEIDGYQDGLYAKAYGLSRIGASFFVGWAAHFGSTDAIDALRIMVEGSGNFDAGPYALYGVR